MVSSEETQQQHHHHPCSGRSRGKIFFKNGCSRIRKRVEQKNTKVIRPVTPQHYDRLFVKGMFYDVVWFDMPQKSHSVGTLIRLCDLHVELVEDLQ